MINANLEKLLEERIHRLLEDERYKTRDPFGLKPERFIQAIRLIFPLYQEYFRVRVFQKENILPSPMMIFSNHSGQLPFDGMMLVLGHLLSAPEPIILRAMAERFLMGLPFLGKLAAETGAILGDRNNCKYILEKKESVLIFPEGVKGISKSTPDFYHLKSFSLGFIRLALAYKISLQPVAIVGAEECYPWVVQLPFIAKLFNLPSAPITPFFPLLGPLGLIPMPAPIDIYYGKPIELPSNLSADSSDQALKPIAHQLQKTIQEMVDMGRKNQRPMLDDQLKENLKDKINHLKTRWQLIKIFLQK